MIRVYDEVTTIFKKAIADGIRRGAFQCAYRSEATNAILTMCNSVSSWYRSDGRLTPKAIADRYATLVLEMVGGRSG